VVFSPSFGTLAAFSRCSNLSMISHHVIPTCKPLIYL
jgi:hypothetical protein